MFLLFMFLQIQVFGLIIVAVVLARNLGKSVAPIRHKNAIRMDGTHSHRRELIERQSIRHASNSIIVGLATMFLLTAVVGLVATGICYVVVGLDLEPLEVSETRVGFEKTMDWAFVSFFNYWQWPLVTCYALVSLFVFPPYLTYLYRKAQQQYRVRANSRFQQYYQQEWWNQTQARTASEQQADVESQAESAINST